MQNLEDNVSSGLDINESLKQLSGFIEQLKSMKPPVYCSHQLINTVLRAYDKRAEEYDIDMDIHVDLTERFDINETEFAVVLSNALNNAVDACLALSENEPRSISVRLTSRSGQIAAEVTNTFDGNVDFDDNHIPVSAKGHGHGMGTRSMNTFSVNNGGTLDFSCEGNMFTVRLLV